MSPPHAASNKSTPGADQSGAPRVFVSYSRKDHAFVEGLARDLNQRGCLCDYDVIDTDSDNVALGISAEDDWWKRLQDMITRAQVVVFVLSSHSARSTVCDEEVGFAVSSAKRVVPVTFGAVDMSTLPPRVSALNVAIHFGDGLQPQYERSLNKLISVVKLDVAWHRTAADVAVAARKWNALGRANDTLAGGAELQVLQEWASRRPASAPPHSELILAFLTACNVAEAERVATLEA